MSLVNKKFIWGTWDITFKENGILESVGDFNGEGTYKKIGNLTYSININNTKYDFTFDNEEFNVFTSNRCKDGYKERAFCISNQNLTSDPTLINNQYRWGSWDITFKENGVVKSVGDFNGEGTYKKIGNLTYSININNTKYIFTFDNEQFKKFTSYRCKDGYKEEGFNYADYPNKIRKPECQTNGNIRTKKGVSTGDVVGAALDLASHVGYALAVLSLLNKK
jgi:hypothetical protein